MKKKYFVRLSVEERSVLEEIIKKPEGASHRVRRSRILLKADADGKNWTDEKIAEAFGCHPKTVKNIRKCLVTNGFEMVLNGQKRLRFLKGQKWSKPYKKMLDGEQEAKLVAMRLGSPPDGFANWSLRLLTEQIVESKIVDSISHETVRQILKKNGITRRT